MASFLVSCNTAEKSPLEAEYGTEYGTDYQVYFLGGQSNMDGFGFTTELPNELLQTQSSVRIYAGNSAANGEDGGGLGIWAPLTPGFGTGFHSDGVSNALSERFGPELSFAARLKHHDPDRNIALIKYSRGGTSLALGASGYGDWAPDYVAGNGRNSYDNALTTIAGAFSDIDIDGDGRPDRLIPRGIIWMQGESDAVAADAAAAYQANLTDMIERLRAALRVDDLPVVIGQIKDSGDSPETRVMPHSPEVIATQRRYVAADDCAALVIVTEGFNFLPGDGWHYRSENYIELGQAFADAVLKLEANCDVGQLN